MMHAIRCEDVQERLEEFHDDELTLEQRVAIQSHLHDCVTCSLVAADLEDLRQSLRQAAWHLPDRDAPEADRLPGDVMERFRVEEQFSLKAEIRALFQDMHLVWAALGATAAMLVCLIGSISVLHAANQERPDSLAGLITFLANPGSNENPVRLDTRMLAPRTRVDDGSAPLPLASDDEVYALSAVVTREGRIQNLELLVGDRPRGPKKVRPDVLLAMLQQASQVEFEPAKSTPTGDPVAVSMVWVLANTTVKGRPTDDVILTRRPPSSAPAIDRVPATTPKPVGLGRPATDGGFLS